MERVAEADNRRRIVMRTDGTHTSSFVIPPGIHVERVVYISSDFPTGLLCFETPVTRSWLRTYSMNGVPESEDGVRALLKSSYARFLRPVWYILDDTMYLYPPAPCDGSMVVDYVD